ncbi:hypothetical protein [Lysobacter enzymogenes]|uniref:hypothetical protein n=1 Tax=Lysobacter enzymogenes TaxID=69 RepID=UPI000899BF7F|nr:hypothetical protein [Lysobacter enzymogenes]SDW33536.1 hypothetical protein SAMN05421681_101748 [Lysobacter enzymogenes]
MPHYRRLAVVGLAMALLATVACVHTAAPEPARAHAAVAADARVPVEAIEAVSAFYRLHMRAYADGSAAGLPQGPRLAACEPLLTRALRARLQKALRLQDRFIAEHPGDKPPLIEDDVFSSAFQDENLVGFAPGAAEALAGDRARIDIALTVVAEPDPARQRHDRALMRREDGAWKLDDIEFDTAGAGGNARLSLVLEEAFR